MDNSMNRAVPQAMPIPSQQQMIFPQMQTSQQQVMPPQMQTPQMPPQTRFPTAPSQDTSAELERFRQTFPNLFELVRQDSKILPKPVWELVAQGITLTDAVCLWLDQQQAQNLRNSHRSAGSMRSAGRDTTQSDPFLRGFYAND